MGGPSTVYIRRAYPADRLLSKCRVFSPEAPRRSSPIESTGVVSRKRLTDYVCSTKDGDTDERTNCLYIVPPISPDLKPPRLLFLFFPSPPLPPPLSLLLHPLRLDRPANVPPFIKTVYRLRCHQLTDVSVRLSVHQLSISSPAKRTSARKIHIYILTFQVSYMGTCISSFPGEKFCSLYSFFSSSLSDSDRYINCSSLSLRFPKSLRRNIQFRFSNI